MIKRFLLYVLREEIAAIHDEQQLALEKVRSQGDHIIKSVALSFATQNKHIADQIASVVKITDSLEVEVRANFASLSDEIDLQAGAHSHLDDIVQGICDELNKDHEVLGVLFDDVMWQLDDLSERLDDLES